MKKTLYTLLSTMIIGSLLMGACTSPQESETKSENMEWKISLAQWSLHKSFFGDVLNGDWETFGRYLRESPDSLYQGVLHPDDFPEIAKGYGFDIIELVNTFYFSKANDMNYWAGFKEKCDQAGVQVGLIMCDALGNMGDSDPEARQQAVENHHAWVDIAQFLGAETVRVNAGGDGTPEEVAARVVESLTKLGQYGADKGINIVVENHGGYSSNGAWLAGIMQEVNMSNVGTLPDFGNFCMKGVPGNCEEEYDMYQGTAELMPFAKGVSAKTNDFAENGDEADKDYYRLMQIVKDSGFKGNIGIEYEGDILSEDEGIKASLALLEKVFAQMQGE